MTRNEVAKKIGVDPNTILRWEKKRISPVRPKRTLRTGRLVYPSNAVQSFKLWMNKTEDATFGGKKK